MVYPTWGSRCGHRAPRHFQNRCCIWYWGRWLQFSYWVSQEDRSKLHRHRDWWWQSRTCSNQNSRIRLYRVSMFSYHGKCPRSGTLHSRKSLFQMLLALFNTKKWPNFFSLCIFEISWLIMEGLYICDSNIPLSCSERSETDAPYPWKSSKETSSGDLHVPISW